MLAGRGNGYVDDVYGYDFVNRDADPHDDHGHGTHVAGTIAAVGNNGVGVVGVAWTARLMAVKFLSASGSGYVSDAVLAVRYAADMGAKVLNTSWGGGGFSQALLDATAGDFDADGRAYFSSYGATSVDLGAPGVGIVSTVPAVGASCCADPSGYKALNGTSMATPHVAGAAVLLFARFPGSTHHQVKARLLGRTDPRPSLAGRTVTGGRLNVPGSLEEDGVPPAAVANLAVVGAGGRSVTLGWTAPVYDVARVDVSTDGVLWTPVWKTTLGTAGAMVPVDVPLTGYGDRVIRLRFNFDTGDSTLNAFEGWVVDDVVVTVAR